MGQIIRKDIAMMGGQFHIPQAIQKRMDSNTIVLICTKEKTLAGQGFPSMEHSGLELLTSTLPVTIS
jgi:hypothetical protein